jgi:hypothetical protein
MRVDSTTIEKTYRDGETVVKRVTMVDCPLSPGDTVPEGHFWEGWKVTAVVNCNIPKL